MPVTVWVLPVPGGPQISTNGIILPPSSTSKCRVAACSRVEEFMGHLLPYLLTIQALSLKHDNCASDLDIQCLPWAFHTNEAPLYFDDAKAFPGFETPWIFLSWLQPLSYQEKSINAPIFQNNLQYISHGVVKTEMSWAWSSSSPVLAITTCNYIPKKHHAWS